MVTLHDIARAAGTSVSTVSRVLSGGLTARRISAEMRQRVSTTAEQLGYRPNLLARSLRTQRTQIVALLVSDVSTPHFGRLAADVERELHRHGYSMIVCNTRGEASLERDYLRQLPPRGIDGLMVSPLLASAEDLQRLVPGDLPVVVWGQLAGMEGLRMPVLCIGQGVESKIAAEQLVQRLRLRTKRDIQQGVTPGHQLGNQQGNQSGSEAEAAVGNVIWNAAWGQ